MGNRLDTAIIGVATVVVSAAVGLTLWAGAGIAWPAAVLAAGAVALVQVYIATRSRRSMRAAASRSGRTPSRSAPATPLPTPDIAMQNRMEAVESGLRVVAQRVWDLDQRITELDRTILDRSRDTVKALAAELDMVGAVVRDLAEAVALHETELFAGPAEPAAPVPAAVAEPVLQATRAPPAASSAPPVELPSDRVAARLVEPAEPELPAKASAPPAAPPREASQTAKRAVITGMGVELFLQSIVTLPQRKVRLYEAQPRVREPDGGFCETDDLAEAAFRLGVSASHDASTLTQVAKIVRHLAARDRDVPVVCPVHLTSLSDQSYFELLSDVAAEGPGISGRLVLRVSADQLAAAGPLESETLEAVRGLGIRLLLDGVHDLRLDPHGLARRGVRYIKVPLALLAAGAQGAVPTEIHPADLAGFTQRHGLSLIVSGVGDDTASLEAGEYATPLGQGDAFAGPRPVRLDVIEQDLTRPARPSSETAAGQPAATASEPPRAGPADAPPAGGEARAEPQRVPLRAFLRRTSA